PTCERIRGMSAPARHTSHTAHIDAADLERAPSRLGAWLRRRPIVGDLAIAVVACAGHFAATLLRGDEFAWWGYGYALIAITFAALLVRRRYPFAVLVVTAIACVASPLTQAGFGVPMIPFAFALYTVASLRSTVWAISGYVVGLAASVVATFPYSLAGQQPPIVAPFDTFTVAGLVVGLIVRNRRERRRMLAERVNERIALAAATERTRIAAEMHDVVAHSLTVIISLANGAASIRSKRPDKADAAVDEIADIGRDALDDLHRVLRLLRDADAGLDENLHASGGNLPTLDDLAERVRAAGLPVTLRRTGPELPDDEAMRHAVYRIAQEALTNSLRHARGATGATVTVAHEPDAQGGAKSQKTDAQGDVDPRGDTNARRQDPVSGTVTITVDDDGLAPGPGSTGGHGGHGITGIGHRAESFGGFATAGPVRAHLDEGAAAGADAGVPKTGWRVRAVLRTELGTEPDA
ncbi:MAG: sensor histidine kinase, partial [Pseudoclavibacter sp.]